MQKITINCETGAVSSVDLTPEEVQEIAIRPGPTPAEQLTMLDVANQLTQRNLRETIMLMNEAFKTISGGALDLGQIPGVAQVYAVEAEAAALRAQL